MKNKTIFAHLFFCMALLASCKSPKPSAMVSDETIDSFFRACNCGKSIISVPTGRSKDRRDEFKNKKFKILDSVAKEIDSRTEVDELQIDSVESLRKFLRRQILNTSLSANGMRIYLGSRRKKDVEDKEDDLHEKEDGNNSGRLVFIFNPTVAIQDNLRADIDTNHYYVHRNNNKRKEFHAIPFKRAKNWVHYYQDTANKKVAKRLALQKTLPAGKRKETKHIWFSRDKVEALADQIRCCSKKHSEIVGMKLRMISYLQSEVPYAQRSSIDFVFTDSTRRELDFSKDPLLDLVLAAGKIMPDKKRELYSFYMNSQSIPFDKSNAAFYNIFVNSKDSVSIKTRIEAILSYDTGMPSPPPDKRREGLDLYED